KAAAAVAIVRHTAPAIAVRVVRLRQPRDCRRPACLQCLHPRSEQATPELARHLQQWVRQHVAHLAGPLRAVRPMRTPADLTGPRSEHRAPIPHDLIPAWHRRLLLLQGVTSYGCLPPLRTPSRSSRPDADRFCLPAAGTTTNSRSLV